MHYSGTFERSAFGISFDMKDEKLKSLPFFIFFDILGLRRWYRST